MTGQVGVFTTCMRKPTCKAIRIYFLGWGVGVGDDTARPKGLNLEAGRAEVGGVFGIFLASSLGSAVSFPSGSGQSSSRNRYALSSTVVVLKIW